MDNPSGTKSFPIAASLAPGACIAVLMSLMACCALGFIPSGPWPPLIGACCLTGALAVSIAFSFELSHEGGTVALLAAPILLLATVLGLCLTPDMVLAWF
ncbi:MAG: hypothetical protein FJ261_02860 [Planctomycetes bacterium]|nr:hypothetical protein [Planctomycetota bacterium]